MTNNRLIAISLGIAACLVAPYAWQHIQYHLYDEPLPGRVEALWKDELERLRKNPAADPEIVRAFNALNVVSGKVIVDKKCAGACTKFCSDDPSAVEVCSLALDPGVFRGLMRKISTDPLSRKIALGLLIKEGETIRYAMDDPPMHYEFVSLKTHFDAVKDKKPAPKPLQIEIRGQAVPSDLDTVARVLLCKWVELESVGYLMMLRYFSQEGVTAQQLQGTPFSRGEALLKIIETTPPPQRDLAVRISVMDQELVHQGPKVRMWVLEQIVEQNGGWHKYKRKPEDFAFLKDLDLIHAKVTTR
jgi:hypothetical protein